MIIQYTAKHGLSGLKTRTGELWLELRHGAPTHHKTAQDAAEADDADAERLLVDDEGSLEAFDLPVPEEKLSLRETAWLSLEFCMLWFLANYFASACLEYTSVGSVTILTSTSSVWTLVFCAVMKVEGFTYRKLMGVLASMAGVILISSIDLSGASDDNRGNFPHKTRTQVAIGDAMAFFSAIVYGMYVTVMKRSVGNEDRVDMPLFFGLVGLFNVVFLWPGFFILHFTGIEPFALPPSGKVWAILMVRCYDPQNTEEARLTCHAAQLDIVLCQRHVVGVRHAADDASRGDGGAVAHDTAVADRGDDSVRAVLQLDLLDRGWNRVPVVPLREPRKQGGGGSQGAEERDNLSGVLVRGVYPWHLADVYTTIVALSGVLDGIMLGYGRLAFGVLGRGAYMCISCRQT